MFELDFMQTLAFAGVALLLGEGLRRAVPVLGRYNLPAPVLGGLLVALATVAARTQGVTLVEFDTTLQSPLMIAFGRHGPRLAMRARTAGSRVPMCMSSRRSGSTISLRTTSTRLRFATRCTISPASQPKVKAW